MYIDTHAHLDFEQYDQDREVVIQRAISNNVTGIITIGTDIESSRQAVLLADKYAAVYAAVGIHPTDCANISDMDFDIIKELAGHEKVVAIGEVGLDYHHMRAPKEVQIKVFNLPLIIHNRESHEDMLKLIDGEGIGNIGGVMHSFSGDADYLEKVLTCHLYVSFTGNITFKKNTSIDLIKNTSLESLLLETDSPFKRSASL